MTTPTKEIISTAYIDNFGHLAVIKEVNIRAYDDVYADSYMLSLYDTRNNNFLYFVSCYEDYESAIKSLRKMSCDTWRKVI